MEWTPVRNPAAIALLCKQHNNQSKTGHTLKQSLHVQWVWKAVHSNVCVELQAGWVFFSMLFALEWVMWSSISGPGQKQVWAGNKLLLRTSRAAGTADSENSQYILLNVNHFHFMLFQSYFNRHKLSLTLGRFNHRTEMLWAYSSCSGAERGGFWTGAELWIIVFHSQCTSLTTSLPLLQTEL